MSITKVFGVVGFFAVVALLLVLRDLRFSLDEPDGVYLERISRAQMLAPSLKESSMPANREPAALASIDEASEGRLWNSKKLVSETEAEAVPQGERIVEMPFKPAKRLVGHEITRVEITNAPDDLVIAHQLGLEGDDAREAIRTLMADYRVVYSSLSSDYQRQWADFKGFEPQESWPAFRETPGVQHLQDQLDLAKERFVTTLRGLSRDHPRSAEMVVYLRLELN